MAKGTLKQGRISHKRKRIFVQSSPQRTLLIKVGKIAYTVGQRCVRKYGSTYAVCIVRGKGAYAKVAVINNTVVTNRHRHAYAKGMA